MDGLPLRGGARPQPCPPLPGTSPTSAPSTATVESRLPPSRCEAPRLGTCPQRLDGLPLRGGARPHRRQPLLRLWDRTLHEGSRGRGRALPWVVPSSWREGGPMLVALDKLPPPPRRETSTPTAPDTPRCEKRPTWPERRDPRHREARPGRAVNLETLPGTSTRTRQGASTARPRDDREAPRGTWTSTTSEVSARTRTNTSAKRFRRPHRDDRLHEGDAELRTPLRRATAQGHRAGRAVPPWIEELRRKCR